MQPLAGSAYWDVYEVLDDLRVAEAVSVGSLRKMYSAIDELRGQEAPASHIALVEQITVAMHRLEAARRRKDSEAEDEARNQLDGMVAEWFDKRLARVAGPSRLATPDNNEEPSNEERKPVPTISQAGRFVQFRRSDGSLVACQVSRVLYVAKGDHGAILQFGSGTQLNLRNSFEEVLYLLEVEEG
ncbi:hypothetical protein [Altererythrobacter sp. GH1-8]|uniref:hypothetical protein n=1 Tax=Altererythrobacter sp. GH1-8 TaxID=3349333 RepID=UPI00374D1C65